MADIATPPKGMRTFASDFARAKQAQPSIDSHITKPSEKKVAKTKTAAPTKKTEKSTANKIPAFHELEKAVKNLGVDESKPKSKPGTSAKKTKGITTNRQVGGGTVVRDTKKSSFSLFGESKKGIVNWFSNLFKRKKKSAPKLAVPQADRRKGVIQQATTKTGTIFTADNETLKERIKERNRQQKAKEHEPETNWSPYTETGFDLLEGGITESTTNVSVEFKKRSIPPASTEAESEPETTTPAPAPVTLDTPDIETDTKQTSPKTTVLEVEVAEEASTPADLGDAKTPETETTVISDATDIDTNIDVAPTTPIADALRVDEETEVAESASLSTNQLTLYISAAVALIGITAFFVFIIVNNQPNQATDTDTITKESAITALTIDENFTSADLRSYQGQERYTEIVLANSAQETLPAALVFALVVPDLPISIQQYATEVHFIQYETMVPQLIMKVADPVSVTGAMLMNEDTLGTQLKPLYGDIPAGTYTDQTLLDTDVRVLQTNSRDSLTYGIVGGETLIIAVDPDAFAQIAILLQE